MIARHMTIKQLPYGKPVQSWLKDRYGETEANQIWEQTQENYRNYLRDLPDYGGSKNGHARAIYGGLLIFALYPVLPDQPPVSELQDFVQKLFMGPFTKLGKIFDLNRPSHMWLIDKVFRRSGNKDRKDILQLLCNSHFFGISEIHGTLIRCGTCGNCNVCDYLVVGSNNPIAAEYKTVPDEQGFLVSRKSVCSGATLKLS